MGNNEEEACDTGLQLGLRLYSGTATQTKKDYNDQKTMMIKPLIYFDWFNLCPKEDQRSNGSPNLKPININMDHQGNRNSSAGTKNVKDNDFLKNNHNNNHDRRKKLKLTKDQSDFLEDYFKLNTTLDPAKKQALADQLNLKPRQLSVWFQNRRARTKLKQTEEDYQLLKKHCENLSHENRRLKKELQEHRSVKVEPSNELSTIQFPSTTAELTTCLSCGKISRADRLLADRDNNSAN